MKYFLCVFLIILTSCSSTNQSWEETANVLNLKNGIIKFSNEGQLTGEIEAENAIFEDEKGRVMQFEEDVQITIDENGAAQITAKRTKILNR